MQHLVDIIPHGPGAKMTPDKIERLETLLLQTRFCEWVFDFDNAPSSVGVLERLRNALSKFVPADLLTDTYVRRIRYKLQDWEPWQKCKKKYDWKKMLPRRCHLPAGRYIISDPCYVIPSERWVDFISLAYNYDNPDPKYTSEYREEDRIVNRWNVFDWEVPGKDVPVRCAIYSTVHGDGTYHATHGPTVLYLGVDAGTIGFIPVEAMEGTELAAGAKALTTGTEEGQYIDSSSGISLEYYYDCVKFQYTDTHNRRIAGSVSLH